MRNCNLFLVCCGFKTKGQLSLSRDMQIASFFGGLLKNSRRWWVSIGHYRDIQRSSIKKTVQSFVCVCVCVCVCGGGGGYVGVFLKIS